MEIEFTFRPIDKWPGKQSAPCDRCSPFKAGWSNTMIMLRRELGYLNAKNAVIMLAISENEIRLDGLPRADARPAYPGVIVAFDSKFGPLKLPCDACRDWQQNARAVAYHLQHLRMSAIYGVGRYGEQYTGWKALPPPIVTAPPMSVESAAQFITGYVPGLNGHWRDLLSSPDNVRMAYRRAAAVLHPDRPDSHARLNPDLWQRLQDAKTVLERHHQPASA